MASAVASSQILLRRSIAIRESASSSSAFRGMACFAPGFFTFFHSRSSSSAKSQSAELDKHVNGLFRSVSTYTKQHRNLSSISLFHQLLQTRPSSSSSSSITVDFLMNSCGLSLKSAIATSQKLRGFDEKNLDRPDSVINLFKSHGFDTAHISKIIQKQPYLLNEYKVEENLKPKLDFLVECGFSGPLLHDLIVRRPQLLTTSFDHIVVPSLDILSSFLGTQERLKLAVKRNPRLLWTNLKATLQPNIDLLLKEGVPLHALTNYLLFKSNHLQSKVDRVVAALDVAKRNLNMRPTDPGFLLAVLIMASIGVPLWENKMQVFMSLGFSQQQAFSIFKRYPQCFGFSEEKLGIKLNFYFNTVKLKRDDIISYPCLLSFAIETRVRPMHNVLLLLLSKKLLKEEAKIAKILTITEEKFLSKYVIEHLQEVPSLLEMYNNDKAVKDIGL